MCIAPFCMLQMKSKVHEALNINWLPPLGTTGGLLG